MWIAKNISGLGPVPGPVLGPGPLNRTVPVPVISGPDDWSRSRFRSFLVPMIGRGPGPIFVSVPVPVTVQVPWRDCQILHMKSAQEN